MKKLTNRGFTLVEMLIIIFMMAMISTALILNFKQGDARKRVNLTRDNVITALRTAQNYTLAGKQIPTLVEAPRVRGNASCGSNTVTTPSASFWIEFTGTNTADLMGEAQCTGGNAVMRIQTFNLINSTEFPTSAFSITTTASGTSTASNLAVRFTAPFATMTATTTATPVASDFNIFTTASVKAQYNNTPAYTKVITVDGISGKIE